jgi:hypothetical protein
MFAQMLTRIDRLPRVAFPLDDLQYDKLQAAVDGGRNSLSATSATRNGHVACVTIAVPKSGWIDSRDAAAEFESNTGFPFGNSTDQHDGCENSGGP